MMTACVYLMNRMFYIASSELISADLLLQLVLNGLHALHHLVGGAQVEGHLSAERHALAEERRHVSRLASRGVEGGLVLDAVPRRDRELIDGMEWNGIEVDGAR